MKHGINVYKIESGGKLVGRWTAGGGLSLAFDDGWAGGLAMRRVDYDAAPVDVATLSVEKYTGDFRGAYTLALSRVNGGRSAEAHSAALARRAPDPDLCRRAAGTEIPLHAAGSPARDSP